MNLFHLLFTTKIPDALRFQSFSAPHFAFIVASAVGVALVGGVARASSPERAQRILSAVTWSLPCVYLIKFTIFWLLDVYVEPQMSFLDRLPFHLCAINAIVMPIAVFRQNKTLLNYIYALAMPAAFAAILTPAMSYYGSYFFLSWQVIFFFLDHSLMVAVPILCIESGLLRPDARMLPRVFALILSYAAVIYPLNKLLGQNFLFLNGPDEGTLLTWFAKYFGIPGYLLPLAGLAACVMIVMVLPWAVADKKRERPAC